MAAPDLPSLLSLDGMHAYVERHYGETPARVVGGLVVLAICALSLGAIFAVLRAGYTAVSAAVTSRSLPYVDPQTAWTASSAFAALVGLALWLSRRIARVNNEVKHVADYLDENVHVRIQKLASDVATFKERTMDQIDSLRNLLGAPENPLTQRITALERISHPTSLASFVLQQVARRLVIRHARYGRGDRWNDETLAVQLHEESNQIDMLVENKTFNGRDPCYGVPKILEVTYSVGDHPPKTIEVPEHGRLRLPQ